MSDFFIHSITLFRFGDTNKIEQYPNVYFRSVQGIADITKGVITNSSGTITIPTKAPLDIQEGDYIVEGLLEDPYGYINTVRDLTESYTVYKVLKVHDNRKGKLQHYKLEVKD